MALAPAKNESATNLKNSLKLPTGARNAFLNN
jgi:hypothetical protein